MEQYNRYEFEGEVVEVPVFWDDHLQREVEDYEDYCKQPGHTPSGRPVLLNFEDACPHGVLRPDGMGDCGSCIHYRQAPGTLLGVCGSPHLRIPIRKGGQGKTPTEEAETEEKNHAKEDTTL